MDEGRKRVIGVMAVILAARKLAQWDGGKRVPATVAAIADAVRWAEEIMREIDARFPSREPEWWCMKKYIASFALIFALAVYVSVQDKHPVQDSAHREWNAPRWYGFVQWPDGAATWAVLLTLLAIAEQTAIANKPITG